jgi:hypothetical protein
MPRGRIAISVGMAAAAIVVSSAPAMAAPPLFGIAPSVFHPGDVLHLYSDGGCSSVTAYANHSIFVHLHGPHFTGVPYTADVVKADALTRPDLPIGRTYKITMRCLDNPAAPFEQIFTVSTA